MNATKSSEARIPTTFLRRPNFSTATPNERTVLHIIRRDGTSTRAEISRETGLAAQSISRIVEGLIERNLVQTGERLRTGRGQPSVALQLVPDVAYSFGVSIMPDSLSVVLINFAGSIAEERLVKDPPSSREDVIELTKQTLDNMLEDSSIDVSRVFGLGVSISGYFVHDDHTVNPPSDMEDWALLDAKSILSDHLDLPVWIENDGNAAAIGESLLGAGLQSESFVYLYFAAGFGGGILIDGKPVRGFHGNAGDLGGLIPMLDLERPSLESLRLILARNGIELENIAELVERYDPEWPGLDEWIDGVVDTLSIVVSSIAVIVDPELIILGGRIPRDLAERLIPKLRIANSSRRDSPRPEPKLVVAEAQGDAAAIGAATLPFKNHFFL